jgi:hypothetical protein
VTAGELPPGSQPGPVAPAVWNGQVQPSGGPDWSGWERIEREFEARNPEPPLPPGFTPGEAEAIWLGNEDRVKAMAWTGGWAALHTSLQPLQGWLAWRSAAEDASIAAFKNADLPWLRENPEAEADRLEAEILHQQNRKRINREADRRIAAEGRQPLVLVPAGEVLTEPDPPWLVDGLIPQTGIGSLFGPRSVWKSFVALHLQLCVAAGLGFLGRQVVRPGWCCYVLGEGSEGAGLRLRAAVAASPLLAPGLDRFAYVKRPFALTDADATGELITAIRGAAQGQDVSLVVLDAAADFYPAGFAENSAGDIQQIVAACKSVSDELSCFVLLVAHAGLEDAERLRGSSRWGQAFGFEISCEREKSAAEDQRHGWLKVTKEKEGPDGDSIPFRVDLAATGTGRRSLAVSYGHEHGGGGREGEPPEPSATQQRIYGDVVRYVIEHGGEEARGLSASRIEKGVTGTAVWKRQALDQAAQLGILAVQDGRYRPGVYLGWLGPYFTS